MPGEQQTIAKQLMEAYIHSMAWRKCMHKSAESNHKPGEAMVMYLLGRYATGESPGLMVSEISGRLNVTPPTITQHINSLEAQGLVERHADPGDRRVVRILPTDEGRNYVQRIEEARLQVFVDLVQHLGGEESLLFAKTMRKASDYMLAKLGEQPT